MSLKVSFEIQGVRDEDVSVCANGRRWVTPRTSGWGRSPNDPSTPDLLGDPDDPSTPDLLGDPDDPSTPDLLGDPDDPSTPDLLGDPDDPSTPDLLGDPDDPSGDPGAVYFDDVRGCRRVCLTSSRRLARRPPPRYSGAVIVRISPLVPQIDADDLKELADKLDLDGLRQVLKRFHHPSSKPAVTTPRRGCKPGRDEVQQKEPVSTVSLEDLERRAARSAFRPRNSLRRYWRVEGPTQAPHLNRKEATPENGLGFSAAELARSFVKQLNGLPEVDLAYLELAASDPAGPTGEPSAEELSDFQLHLGPSPLGLNALWAQSLLNGSPEKIGAADLEQGWDLGHEDLDVSDPVHGDNRHGVGEYLGNHGTAVLSELAATSGNRLGIVGPVSGISEVVVASHYHFEGAMRVATNGYVAEAIVALVTGDDPPLKAGDVLLLEVEKGGQPTEADPLDFDAIRLAVASGVIVVEAAGNGGRDLDRLVTVDGRTFRRGHAGFRDSGAIMVGAARAPLPHDRAGFSNYGTRLDCFAWGEGVVAAGYGDYLSGEGDHETYTDKFSGTSAAAPMIAGAAIMVQSIYQEYAGSNVDDESWKRLSPREMRSLLSDPRYGTRQGPRVRGHIGVMPDLRAILERALGIVPRVYLRDHGGDTGEPPYAGRMSSSPDIIVANSSASAAQFGEGSGTENAHSLGLNLAPKGKKRLFVRMKNRGLRTAETKATVYKAPIVTLVTPDLWTPIGQTKLEVHPGDTLAVSEVSPLDCNLNEDCCLVAVANHDGGAEGPVPHPVFAFNWKKCLRVMRDQSNIAVRNVHALPDDSPCEFKINGTPDVPRRFVFEVIQRLPSDATVRLTAQAGLALKFSRGRLWKVVRKNDDQATLYLPKLPRLRLGAVRMPAGIGFPCSFELKGKLQSGHSLAIRQLFNGQEVGRITWRRP